MGARKVNASPPPNVFKIRMGYGGKVYSAIPPKNSSHIGADCIEKFSLGGGGEGRRNVFFLDYKAKLSQGSVLDLCAGNL